MAIKSRLKVLLAMHDMTQTELAQRTGIRPSTLSAICRNKIHSMPVRVIDRICKALDCQPGDFMEYYPDPEPEAEMETGSRMVPEKG